MGSFKKSEEIIGKTVANTDGLIMGEVTEIWFSTADWRVTDLQVKMNKEVAKDLGLKTPFFGSLLVPFAIDLVQAVGDQVMLDLNATAVRPYVEQRIAEAKASKKGKPIIKEKPSKQDESSPQEEPQTRDKESEHSEDIKENVPEND